MTMKDTGSHQSSTGLGGSNPSPIPHIVLLCYSIWLRYCTIELLSIYITSTSLQKLLCLLMLMVDGKRREWGYSIYTSCVEAEAKLASMLTKICNASIPNKLHSAIKDSSNEFIVTFCI